MLRRTRRFFPSDGRDQASTHFTIPQKVEGWVDLVGRLRTEIVYLPAGHRSTNRARRRVTLFYPKRVTNYALPPTITGLYKNRLTVKNDKSRYRSTVKKLPNLPQSQNINWRPYFVLQNLSKQTNLKNIHFCGATEKGGDPKSRIRPSVWKSVKIHCTETYLYDSKCFHVSILHSYN